jgi:hypothetical protein
VEEHLPLPKKAVAVMAEAECLLLQRELLGQQIQAVVAVVAEKEMLQAQTAQQAAPASSSSSTHWVLLRS